LSAFQLTPFNEDEFKKLIASINDACNANKLSTDVLDNVFRKWWPDLEEEVSSIIADSKKETGGRRSKKPRTERDILEEMLSMIRMQSTSHRPVFRFPSVLVRDLSEKYVELISIATKYGDSNVLSAVENLSQPISFILDNADSRVSRMHARKISEKLQELSVARNDDEIPF
jgi:hypothetical protein